MTSFNSHDPWWVGTDFPDLELNQTAFDIDGVVIDVVTPLLKILADQYGYTGFTAEDITEFDLTAALGVPETVVREAVGLLLDQPLAVRAQPYPEATETLAALCLQEPLVFITARHRADLTRELLASALPHLPAHRYEVVATGDPFRKLEWLRTHGRTYLVDDHLETCRQLARAGLRPILFDQPWNRHDHDLFRVKGWPDLARIFGLAGRNHFSE